MNIDHFINMVFKATFIQMSDCDEVDKQILFSESVDVTAQY